MGKGGLVCELGWGDVFELNWVRRIPRVSCAEQTHPLRLKLPPGAHGSRKGRLPLCQEDMEDSSFSDLPGRAQDQAY